MLKLKNTTKYQRVVYMKSGEGYFMKPGQVIEVTETDFVRADAGVQVETTTEAKKGRKSTVDAKTN